MKKPIVSVVIPTYNRSGLLQRAIDSVIIQTHPPTEIIIVDDGSTDGTITGVLSRFCKIGEYTNQDSVNSSDLEVQEFDRHQLEFNSYNSEKLELYLAQCNEIRQNKDSKDAIPIFYCELINSLNEITRLVYCYQPNSGGNVARNNGIKSSNGDFVAFLDSDDRWHPQKIEKQLIVFNANPRAGAVYCGLLHENLDTHEIVKPTGKFRFPNGNILTQLLIEDGTAPTSCYMIKREVFSVLGYFDENLKARQDLEMWLRISTQFEIDCIPENLVYYGEHSFHRTSSNPENEILAFHYIREKYKKYLDELSWLDQRKALAYLYKRKSKVELHYKFNRKNAIKYAFISNAVYPFSLSIWKQFLRVFI